MGYPQTTSVATPPAALGAQVGQPVVPVPPTGGPGPSPNPIGPVATTPSPGPGGSPIPTQPGQTQVRINLTLYFSILLFVITLLAM